MSYIGNEPIVSATRTVTEITATAGQTTFTANGGYTVGYIDVFVNGAQLQTSDFTATNGSSITLNAPAIAGDDVRLVAWGTFTASNLVAPNYTGTLTGGTGVVNIGSGQLYKDASGNVGIGTSSPTSRLGVSGAAQFIGVSPSVFPTTGSGIEVVAGVAGQENYIQAYNRSGSSWQNLQINAAQTVFGINGTERMRIDSSGRVTTPFQPAFLARKSNFIRTPWAVETTYDSSLIGGNYGVNFSTSTGRFTAPVAGAYLFNIVVRSNDGSTDDQVAGIQLHINGGQYQAIDLWASNAASFSGTRRPSVSASFIVPLAANDYVQTAYVGNIQNAYFSGTLLG